jgi:CheY-like chemotaxis protein
MSGDVQRCFAAGMDAHLTKPFTLQQLHDALLPWCRATHDATQDAAPGTAPPHAPA